MTRGQVLAAAAALLLPLAACGKKGPPLAPLRSVPGPPTDVAARRVGAEMQIHFTLPAQNAAPGEPIDLEVVDVYAVTVAPGGGAPATREFVRRQHLVKAVPVRPLPEEEETAEQPAQAEQPAVKDDRPLPGDRVTFLEELTAPLLRPTVFPKPPVPGKSGQPPPPAFDPPVTTRYYLVVGRSRRGDAGATSPRIALPLVEDPAPPSGVQMSVTETALTVRWTAPPAQVDPVAAAANAQAWNAINVPPPPAVPVPGPPRPAAPDPSAPQLDPSVLARLTQLPGIQLPPTVLPLVAARFNVYAVKDEVQDTPLNQTPLTVPSFEAGQPAWNQETCFVVRTVRTYGVLSVESAPTDPACVTPVDTFPPATPAGLKAVAVPGAMNLIWDANQEADLAGYLVLRGEAPGETLQALTPAPIAETNYKDATVQPGVRYVYAVVAVDRATPPNMSAQSPRVEEAAR